MWPRGIISSITDIRRLVPLPAEVEKALGNVFWALLIFPIFSPTGCGRYCSRRTGSRDLERVKIHRLRAIHANKGLSGNPNLVRGQRIPLSPRASPASSRSPRELRSHLDRIRQRCYVRGARGHPKADRPRPGKRTSGQPRGYAARVVNPSFFGAPQRRRNF